MDVDRSLDEIIRSNDDKRMRPSRISKSHNGRRDYRRNHQPLRGYRVHVTNLYYGLSKEDLEELFSRIAPVQKLWIKYDRSGRSLGEAFVVFSRREDCFEAIRQFDGKKAAGQEIYLTLMDEQGVVSSLRSRFSRSEQREGGRRANELRRDSRNKSKSHKKTPEELDAELEAYMSGTQPQELEQQQEAEPPAAVETTASRNDLANDDANKESSQVYHATDDMAMEA